jgi:hypothetical protein
MPKKTRPKLLKPHMGKKVTPMGKGGGTTPKLSNLTKAEIAEGNIASEKIAYRPTSSFSTSELSALMQIPPGGAEPNQIKTQSRQFTRVSNDMPESVVFDRVISPAQDHARNKPMSAKTPKIDEND